MPQKKICARCKNPFPATEKYFSKHSAQKDGLQPYCRTCQREQMTEYRAKKKEEDMASKAKLKIVKGIRGKCTKDGIVTEKKPKIKTEPMKVCNDCGNELPATLEYFHKSSYKGHEDGLNPKCKNCVAQGVKDRKAGIYKRGKQGSKKQEEQPQFIDDGADWTNVGHRVFYKGEPVAFANDDYWAKRIVDARRASKEAISDKKIVNTIKTLVNKEMTEQMKEKNEEISRLRAMLAYTAPPTEEPKKSLHEIKRDLQMDRDVRLNGQKLKSLIEQNKYKVADVANLIEETEVFLRACMTNGHLIKLGKVKQLAELFELDVGALVARSSQSSVPQEN